MASYPLSPCSSEATHESSLRAPSTDLTALGRLEERFPPEFLKTLESKYNRIPIPYIPSFDFYDRLEDASQQMKSDAEQCKIEQAAELVAHQLIEENDMVEKEYSRAPYHGHIDANFFNTKYNVRKAFPFCAIRLKSFLSVELERLLEQSDRTTASPRRRTKTQKPRRSTRLKERDKIASRQRQTPPQRIRRGEGLQNRDKNRACKRKA